MHKKINILIIFGVKIFQKFNKKIIPQLADIRVDPGGFIAGFCGE